MRGLLINPYNVLAMTVISRPLPLLAISSMIVKSGTIMSPCVPMMINKGTTASSPNASKIIGIPNSTVLEKLPEKALITCWENVRFQNKRVDHIPVNKTINVPK